ncbi:hypothetical protein GNF18_10365 [Ligilactobacillus pobuzihii]|uniref:hypothetical protein n=1 Tax=Ligilactobacillus pobuzihii TaxID=449659 RepID=UPI0019D13477|nr:hypothetical protein [Ligilactobacillus pobuzihii]MBN7275544.1 hypothetical protein [Ligilactobacillus pobuzihii]
MQTENMQQIYEKQGQQIEIKINGLAKENLKRISKRKKTYSEVLQEVRRNRPVWNNRFQQLIYDQMIENLNATALEQKLSSEDFI